jgi:LuxR family maltose regulon positive regulatory protein
MSIRSQVILSQLNPPAQRSHVLVRQRVNALLADSLAYPFTIMHAGTGFGKTTALLSFIKEQQMPVFWFTISPSDRDSVVFLVNLFTACNQGEAGIGTEALHVLDMDDMTHLDALISLLNSLSGKVSRDTLLVLEDFHHIRDVPEIMQLVDWMADHLPGHLHLVITTRRSLDFSSVNRWRAKDSLLELGDHDLAFDPGEIALLFESEYGILLDQNQIQQLFEKTEGWAIGLQMVWQSLRNNPDLGVEKILMGEGESRKALFAYLAEEVLERLDPSLQQFLLKTSILAELETETCDFLLDKADSENYIQQLHTSGLFVDELRPGVYRYHHMFREFLQSRLDRDAKQVQNLHRKIASYYYAHQFWEYAIRHYLMAGDYGKVNQLLEEQGEGLIQDGRYESLEYWIQEIPEKVRLIHPYIHFLLGEINRYQSRFEIALDNYHAAERLYEMAGNNWGCSLALRGQARIYLDTIRPANAAQPLKDALSLLDPAESQEDMASLLILIAENQLNLGDPQSAEGYLTQARELSAGSETETDYITARLLLRTGRIDEGIRLLEQKDLEGILPTIVRPQRFHREGTLLLSLFHAFRGDLEASEAHARQGIEIGKYLGSSFVQSVGLMRLGHPIQMNELLTFTGEGYPRAIALYEESIRKVDVSRIHVEPLWGICRALGFSGRIVEARDQAREALAIARNAGDEWIGILIRISLGASELLAGNYPEAQAVLTEAETLAIKVKDPLSLCASRIWLALNAWQQDLHNSAMVYCKKLLPLVQQHHYEYLLTRVTLLGLPQPVMVIPLLIEARNQNLHIDLVNSLLADLKALAVEFHPGYDLRIQTFGGFFVWRGRQRLDKQDWKREKARQFLQVLVANKGRWLNREQITSILWPEADPETGANHFKVVLNTLNQVLEPERPAGSMPFFIQRRHEQYGLNPNAQIQVDTEIFCELVQQKDRVKLESAARLYQGRYFENEMIEEWFVSEEQYYHQQYIRVMEVLIDRALENGNFETALDYTNQLIARDMLWEPAYSKLMGIYQRMGNIGMVQQVFQQYQLVMQQSLNSNVSVEFQRMYDELMHRKK